MQKYKRKEVIDNITIKRVTLPPLNKNVGFQKLILYLLTAIKIKKIIKRTNFKLSISVLPPFFVAYNTLKVTKLKSKKFILLLHDLHPDTIVKRNQASPKNPLIKLLRKQTQTIFSRSDICIFIGRDQIKYVKNNYKIKTKKIKYIANWAKKNYDSQFISSYYAQNSNSNKCFRILYSGNLGEDSANLLDFLKLMEIIEKKDSNIELTIIGNGRKRKVYENFLEKRKLKNVKIKSFMPENKYIEQLKRSDACLVTLRKEALGMSVPSKTYFYLSVGKPIIGLVPLESEIDLSIREGGYGINLYRYNARNKISNILRLKNDILYYKSLSNNAIIEFQKKYEKDIILNKYYNLFEELEDEF